MKIYGIDVSSENGHIDWSRVKSAGVGFAILRCHQKFGAEARFEANYRGCRENGIPVGAYKYCYAISAGEARAEAKNVLEALEGKTIEYPVFYDLEDGNDTFPKLAPDIRNKIVDTFMDTVRAEGYKAAIYCNKNWYDTVITPEMKEKYRFWIASYPFGDDGSVQERVNPGTGMGWQYSEKGHVDGISGNVDMDVFYVDDAPAADASGTSAQHILDIARSWLGLNEYDGSHRQIVDLYNGHSPLAQGYRVTYSDSWCDAFVSACFIRAGATALIGGTECGVERHVQLFIGAGIWIEDGAITPQPGDIIVFNWGQGYQPNNGYSDHIGLVEAVGSGMIGTIEGNAGGRVMRRQYAIGDGNIRGFARPKYASKDIVHIITGDDDVEALAREVIAGKWGNGRERLDRLTAAGHDYLAVQNMVNSILKGE